MRLWRMIGALLAAVTIGGQAIADEAERRIALIIGIGDYTHVPDLPNPPNDARAIAEALRNLDFEVEEAYDLDNRGFATTLRDFGIKASTADVAVVYYAGHGIQVGGYNYLIPADARLERERDLVYEALPLNLPLGELAQARKLGILILDACRNNPFVDRLSRSNARLSVGAGFARVDDTPSDTLVAMATRADQVAEDGAGNNSPYTAALLEHLKTPGLELSLFFRKVRDTVKQATEDRQEPYIYGSLGATPFYFNPQPPNQPPVVAGGGAIEALDKGPAVSLRVGRPTDPDQDQLFAQVTGLPQGGGVHVGDRILLIGDYLTPEQLAAAAFKADASFIGDAGSFAFTVMDGRGGNVRSSVAITIKPSNRPPVVVAERVVRTVGNPLRFEVPQDPDGDPLTITVVAVPEKGKVLNGGREVETGDKLDVEALTALTFDPRDAPLGRAGTFRVKIDDGRGGEATADAILEVGSLDDAKQVDIEEEVWRLVSNSRSAADFEAFLRIFTNGTHSPLARERLAAIRKAEAPMPSQDPAAPAGSETEEVQLAASPPPAEPEASEAVPDEAVEVASVSDEPVEPPAAEPEAAGLGLFAATTDTNVRAEPDVGANRLGVIAKEEQVRVLERVPDANWLRVALNDGSEGFVYAPLLRPVPDAEATTTVAATPPEEAATAEDEGPQEEQVALLPSIGQVRTHGKANSFQDCDGCPVMVRVPPGSFMMGSNSGHWTEKPVHKVTISAPFAIGAYEVTAAEWNLCVEEGGCSYTPRMRAATDSTPVHNVHWTDAQEYVEWLSKKTGQRYRLPSEAEWEYAARGGTTEPFWWGSAKGIFASCEDCGGTFDKLTPVSVGSFEPNPFGLHDMNGGVAEWVADCWNNDYSGAPTDASAWASGTCSKRVLRGGSWRNSRAEITATSRLGYDEGVRYYTNGFRVARSLN